MGKNNKLEGAFSLVVHFRDGGTIDNISVTSLVEQVFCACVYLRCYYVTFQDALRSTVDSSTMGSKLSVSSLLLLLLLFLVEVHSQQTFPYVSFNLTGPALANHSYVDLSTVGSASDNSDSVVCHTDLDTCCSNPQGIHRGDWYFPNGTVLPFSGLTVPIGLGRGPMRAVIRRTTATGPTGIYRCRIATNAVHSDTNQSVRDSVYVGLYPADGGKLKHRLAADINLPIVSVLANTHQNSTPPSLLHCSKAAGA